MALVPVELLQQAGQILAAKPDPAVDLRLRRDVLRVPEMDPALAAARNGLERNRWVMVLRDEQQMDGSWGRLHSRDTRLKRRVPTTETGVQRALALGLEPTDPVLDRAAAYLAGLLRGHSRPPDPPEKNDRWRAGVQLFAGATLALVSPRHKALDPVWGLWLEIAQRTFASGRYDPQAEIQAHRELTGASVASSYLVMSNRYSLALLASRPDELPSALEQAIFSWVWDKDGGLGYYGESLAQPPNPASTGAFERWLASLELLSAFRAADRVQDQVFSWFAGWRGLEGGWDFGSRAASSTALPLSSSWLRAGARGHDWTTRVLTLLDRFSR